MMKSIVQSGGALFEAGEVVARSTPFDDLAAVHAEHEGRIFRFLLFSLRDSHAAASLTQDTFLAAWQARESFRGECSPGTWLTRIAVRLLQNHVRGQRFRFWARAARSSVDAVEMAEMLVCGTPDAESSLAGRQQVAAVFRVVGELPDRQRTAFLLRFNDDLELPEIAAAMGLSLSATKTHLYRALERVRTECGAARAVKEGR